MKFIEAMFGVGAMWCLGWGAFAYQSTLYAESMAAGRTEAGERVVEMLNHLDYGDHCEKLKLNHCTVIAEYVVSDSSGDKTIYRMRGEKLTLVASVNDGKLFSNRDFLGRDTVDGLAKSLLGIEIKPKDS